MINVLVVDDSSVTREHLQGILNAEPAIQVMGTAKNGREAIEFVQYQKPDVITMDAMMPEMDGFEATRYIMETSPVPIIIVSGSIAHDEISTTMQALEVGAVAVVEKPSGMGHPEAHEMAKKLVQMVKLMSEVKLVRRWPRGRHAEVALPAREPAKPAYASAEIKLVAIGTSTGGPPVLHTILAGLPKNFAVPIVIVQHIAPNFLPGMVAWLGQSTGFPTHIATHGEQLVAGHAYLAPDTFHMGVGRDSRIVLSSDEPEDGQRPAVAHLFRSVAQAFGKHAVGVLLTGMGRDGAAELKLMREQGALTIVQDHESAVVYGMPGEAVKLGAAVDVLPPHEIVARLHRVVEGQVRHRLS